MTPNQRTLLMNPGDKLAIHIFDNKSAGALETQVRDLSTGKTGFMLASAKNGFMNTSIADCSGTPFNFRPEYSTASTINQGGWAAANINVSYEVGHFTPCTKLKVFAPIDVHGHLDKSWNFCTGPYENAGPPDSPGSGETNDAPCFPAGDTHGSLNADPNLVTGCTGGDLDYDGTSYWRNWPELDHPGHVAVAADDHAADHGRGGLLADAVPDRQPGHERQVQPADVRGLRDPAEPRRPGSSTRTGHWPRSAAPACGSSGR